MDKVLARAGAMKACEEEIRVKEKVNSSKPLLRVGVRVYGDGVEGSRKSTRIWGGFGGLRLRNEWLIFFHFTKIEHNDNVFILLNEYILQINCFFLSWK